MKYIKYQEAFKQIKLNSRRYKLINDSDQRLKCRIATSLKTTASKLLLSKV